MNFREILFIGCVVLVLTVCILGFVGSFFRSPQQYEVVSIDSLKLPAALDMKYSPQSPKEFITLEKRAAVEEFYADADTASEKVIEEKIEKVYQHINAGQKTETNPDQKTAPAKIIVAIDGAKKEVPSDVAVLPRKTDKVSSPRKVLKKAEPPVLPAVSKPVEPKKETVVKPSRKVVEHTPAPVHSSSSNKATVHYTVQKGDTLFALSKKFGISRQEIAEHNKIGINSELIIGQKLQFTVPEDTLKNSSAKGSYMVHHIIKSGETISSVAKHYGVSVSDVIEANKNRVKDINIVVKGQELLIPVK